MTRQHVLLRNSTLEKLQGIFCFIEVPLVFFQWDISSIFYDISSIFSQIFGRSLCHGKVLG
jgi:hypothetical protein